jgi:hypothetical protein
MKGRTIIVGTLIALGIFASLLALSVRPAEVTKASADGAPKSVRWRMAERRTPGGVRLAGPCSTRIESLVDAMQPTAREHARRSRAVYVLCGPGGNAYRTVLEYQAPGSGRRFALWYPATTFSGALSASVRLDLFDADGRRTGSVILDRQTGHVDFYDEGSRWIGYGTADPFSGTVQRFDVNGRRRESTELPILPGGL